MEHKEGKKEIKKILVDCPVTGSISFNERKVIMEKAILC